MGTCRVQYKREKIKLRRKCVAIAHKIIIIYFMVTVRFNRLWGNGSEI